MIRRRTPGESRSGTGAQAGEGAPIRPRAFAIDGHVLSAAQLESGLHLVATPIGNLTDITLRALQTLAGADAVLAEDTRMTKRLLSHYGIATPLYAYHEHSGDDVRERIIARIREGEALALVSDAGTPLVSDPGWKLVQGLIAERLRVVPIPGPSAVLAALVVSGLPSDRFFFAGFLPPKSAARRARLSELARIPGTLVLYEAPHRLAEMLDDAATELGPRPAAVARELTKMFETVRRGSLGELAAHYASDEAPRGEIVVLIGEASGEGLREEARDQLDEALLRALATASVKDAAASVAALTGLPRREVYARALALAKAGQQSGEV